MFVGRATHFVSHAWCYRFHDVVDALESFVEREGLDETNTFFWFDTMVVNQHYGSKKFTPGELKEVFGPAVEAIGHTVAIFDRWDKSAYIGRIWCLYEMLITLQTQASKGTRLSVLLPNAQRDHLYATMRTDFNSIVGHLSKIDVKRAEAREESDREAILAAVEEYAGGSEAVNALVIREIRDWLRGSAQAAAEGLGEQMSAEAAQLWDGIGRLHELQVSGSNNLQACCVVC